MSVLLKNLIPVSDKKILGQGQFSVVIRVFHPQTQEYFALKKIDKADLEPLEIAKLQLEFQIHSALSNQKIVKMVESVECDEKFSILYELCPNNCLYFYLNPQRGFPEKLALRFLYQTASAVVFLHANNIIHRDIKPENILFDEDFNIKLSDFGNARRISPRETRKSVCGTYEYMSPEIVREQNHDFKTDIWCLGVLFFELLHGKPPFEDIISLNDLDYHFKSSKIKIKEGLSPESVDLLTKMLDLNQFTRIDISQVIGHRAFQRYMNSIQVGLEPSDIAMMRTNYGIATKSLIQLENPVEILKDINSRPNRKNFELQKPTIRVERSMSREKLPPPVIIDSQNDLRSSNLLSSQLNASRKQSYPKTPRFYQNNFECEISDFKLSMDPSARGSRLNSSLIQNPNGDSNPLNESIVLTNQESSKKLNSKIIRKMLNDGNNFDSPPFQKTVFQPKVEQMQIKPNFQDSQRPLFENKINPLTPAFQFKTQNEKRVENERDFQNQINLRNQRLVQTENHFQAERKVQFPQTREHSPVFIQKNGIPSVTWVSYAPDYIGSQPNNQGKHIVRSNTPTFQIESRNANNQFGKIFEPSSNLPKNSSYFPESEYIIQNKNSVGLYPSVFSQPQIQTTTFYHPANGINTNFRNYGQSQPQIYIPMQTFVRKSTEHLKEEDVRVKSIQRQASPNISEKQFYQNKFGRN